jgi:hypothetical protein
MTIRKWTSFLFCLAVTLGMAAPAFAWPPLADSQEPGSVLVFPSVHTGSVITPDQGTVARTRFEISVVCPPDDPWFDCSQVSTVHLRAHWVCGGNARNICQESDFNLRTTLNGTISFNTENLGPRTDDVPAPPNCPSNAAEEEGGGGYLIVWVIDNPVNAKAMKFDGLIGDEVIAGSNVSARAHGAIPIQANEWLATLDLTDVNGDQKLDFNGDEYKQVTGKIYGSVKYNQPNVETSLVLLTLDVRSNEVNPITSAGLNFYNEKEKLQSSGVNFVCWGEFDLADLPSGASLNGNFGTKGLVTSDPAVQDGFPATMIGVVETEEEFSLPVTGQGSQTVTIGVTQNGSPICSVPGIFITLPSGCACNATNTAISCTVNVNTLTQVPITREYGYPLLNDSVGVPTTFVPKPLPK